MMIEQRIRGLCDKNGISLKAACVASDIAYGTLHAQLKNGREIPFSTMDKLAHFFEVPLSYFIDQNNLTSDHFSGPGYSLEMPCYIYEGFRIWGFTLGVLVDLLNQSLHAGIDLQRPDFSVAERLPQRGRLQAAR